ncbi:MAG: hypothetical protein KF900_08070 [Bacteroidetes bacterium]|nr:hypothetical protein [Bacteroidota bacterium]
MKKAIPFLLAGTLVFTFCKTTKKQENTSAKQAETKPTENSGAVYAEPTVKPVIEEAPKGVAIKEAASNKILEIANNRWANTTLEELAEGKAIFTDKAKCTRCHKAYPIEEFSEKKWLHEIDDMSPKAKLTADEKLKLTKYVLSYREYKAL